MTEHTLTFGAAILPRFPPPDATSTDHFVGSLDAGGSGAVIAYADLIEANSSGTGADITSDDTATFLYADQTGFDADMDARYPPSPTAVNAEFLRFAGRQDAPFILPDGMLDATVTVSCIARTTRVGGGVLNLSWETDEGFYSLEHRFTATRTTTDWTRLEVTEILFPADIETLRGPLSTGGSEVTLWLTGGQDSDGNDYAGPTSDELAYVAVRITWRTARRLRLAHNRGMQRGSDGQGVTGGKRGLQRKSRQSSLRGGSFL